MRTATLMMLALVAAACGDEDCPECFAAPPTCTSGSCVPSCGQATLKARTTFDDYEAATISFKHATVVDNGQVNNDWDLLFGNDRDPARDLFTVNMVVDDRSFIVDLGPGVSICDVPSTLDPDPYPTGMFGAHDNLDVHLGHLYLIRNVDSSTRQLALIEVVGHEINRTATIRWYRSPEPDRFVPPAACGSE